MWHSFHFKTIFIVTLLLNLYPEWIPKYSAVDDLTIEEINFTDPSR
jgi:hypothetical protein